MLNVAIPTKWLYIFSAVFILLTGIGLYFEFYYTALFPVALLFMWLAIYKVEYLLLTVTIFTPLSINIEDLELGGVGMYVPTEPILFGLLLLFIFKTLTGDSIDKRIWKHPISLLVYAYLIWIAITCISSEFPLVSLKFLVAKCWFIASFYFLAVHVFSRQERMKLFSMAYLFPLCIVILYAVTRHAGYGFDKDSSHWVMEPFYKDHTSYGAALALFVPVILGLLLTQKMSLLLRVMLGIAFLILLLGLVLSYTRAAWISVIGAACVMVVMWFRIPLRTLLISGSLLGGLLYFAWDDIEVSLSRNKQESSDRLDEHVSSISNVSSDASNLERLNRWNCAIEMFKERPMFGWGPGTYQFVYAPFQRSKDRTIISTNEGDGGNAHSEYLGPLSEQGLPGMLIMVTLVISVASLAFRLFYTIKNKESLILVMSAFLGLVTYFIHGILNNYLDTDKISVPFWGFIALLVATDIFHNEKNQMSNHISS